MSPAEAHALSEARRLVDLGLSDERRRATDSASVGVAGQRSYRVVSGQCAGMIVPEDETIECPREWLSGCDGTGKRWHQISDDEAVEVTCPVCKGVGRILGIPDGADPVQRLVPVEAAPESDTPRCG